MAYYNIEKRLKSDGTPRYRCTVINRGYSAHTSISLTVPPASLNFAIRLSALCSN